ncbi:xyloglucan endotransglucosylase protein 6-like [Wolffia australiana]
MADRTRHRAGIVSIFFLSFLIFISSSVFVNGSSFDELFEPSWAADHLLRDGDVVNLKLDRSTGAGFGSKNKYLFGRVSAEIKLPAGDTAGTVTAFYMSSEGPSHHEFDFEFLGNTSGEPILLQTNVYVDGTGNREQRIDLWFDPRADFHRYGIAWSRNWVVFEVDETPVRVFRRMTGRRFPDDQAMGVYSSVWNAEEWATRGGQVKVDWGHAPFVTSYRGLSVVGAGGSGDGGRVDKEEEMSVHQSHQLVWVRAHHLVYDYCFDRQRFPVSPPECRA